jgi:N-carbamoyl-L-amino-acid hydrolase
MIFVPCAKGISHSPAESATPEDLAAGTRVLAATLVELDLRLRSPTIQRRPSRSR